MGSTRRLQLVTRISWEIPYASGRFQLWKYNPSMYWLLLHVDVMGRTEWLQLLDTFLESKPGAGIRTVEKISTRRET